MNRSLWIGAAGTVLLLFVVLFGPLLAPYEMGEIKAFDKYVVNGEIRYKANPLPPSADHRLGTDREGHDLLSILLRGAQITITFAVGVAVVRTVIALPLAYAGAQFPRTAGWLIEKVSVAFTTVPSVLIVSLISGVFIFSDAFAPTTILKWMAVLVAFVGLFPTAYVMQQKLTALLQSPFLEGQRAIGTGRWRILRKHLMPHLSHFVTVLFISEIAQTLWLVGQLGMLYLFIGGTKLDMGGGTPEMMMPAEWAGNIGRNLRGFAPAPMLVMYPVLALSFAILSFNLLGDGIRKRNEQKWGIRT